MAPATEIVTNFIHTALDLLYPRLCAACGDAVDGSADQLCWECRADIRPIAHPFCSVCGNPVEGSISHEYVCYLCVETPRFFDRARSAARFEGALQRMIIDFKYNDALWVQDELVDVLVSCHEVHFEKTNTDAVACVPLFHARERSRGFNQSEILADGLASRLRKPFLRGALSRVRATETQTHLTARERADNVKGAFRARRRKGLQGKSILLVDDVMTTGATLNECARALKEGGAAEVHVLTLARGGSP